MAFILILKSREALTKDYRRTEMWLYIDKDFRPPEAYAQWASATILRDTYLTFAMWTSMISITMWVLALIFSVFGTTSTLTRDLSPPAQPAAVVQPLGVPASATEEVRAPPRSVISPDFRHRFPLR